MNVFVFFALQLGIVLFLGRLLSNQKLWRESLIWAILALLVFTAGVFFISSTNYGHELSDPIYYKNVAYFLAAHFQGYDVNFVEHGTKIGKPSSLLQYDHSIFGQRVWGAGDEYGSIALLLDTYHYLYSCYLAFFIVVTGEQVELAIFGNAIFFAGIVQTLFILVQQITKNVLHSRIVAVLLILDSGFLAAGAFLLRDLLVIYFLYLSVLLISTSGSAVDWRRPGLIIFSACIVGSLGVLRYPVFFIVAASVVVVIFMGWRIRNVRPLRYLCIVGISVIVVLFSQLGSDITNPMKVTNHLLYPSHIAKTAFYSQNVVQLDAVKKSKTTVSDTGTTDLGVSDDVQEDAEEKEIQVTIQFDRGDVKRIITSLAHTVFAPYPWSTLQEGFKGNWPELFIVGGLVWMITMPFVLIYISTIISSRDVTVWLMMLISVGLFLAYSVTEGEYSTRPRLMSMPFLWFVAAGGIVRVMSWFKTRKLNTSQRDVRGWEVSSR